MLRKLKWQIPGEPLAARYNWCQGPVTGRGPAVQKHWSRVIYVSDEGGAFIFKVKQSKKRKLLGPEDKGTTLLQNVVNCFPVDTA
jgi:hypothetical protein